MNARGILLNAFASSHQHGYLTGSNAAVRPSTLRKRTETPPFGPYMGNHGRT